MLCRCCGDSYIHTVHEGACPKCWKTFHDTFKTEEGLRSLPKPFRERPGVLDFELWAQFKRREASLVAEGRSDDEVNAEMTKWAEMQVAQYFERLNNPAIQQQARYASTYSQVIGKPRRYD